MELGVDSLTSVELRNRLERAWPRLGPLPPTLMFKYPTISALAQFIVGACFPSPAEVASADGPLNPPGFASGDEGADELEQVSDQLRRELDELKGAQGGR